LPKTFTLKEMSQVLIDIILMYLKAKEV